MTAVGRVRDEGIEQKKKTDLESQTTVWLLLGGGGYKRTKW